MDKLTGIISSAELMGGQIVGMRGLKGDKGDTGNGIASIAKTGTSGDIDTYTITFTDGDTTTFNVTNGHTPVITQVPVATDLWTGTAIYVDGVYLTTIMDGAKGDKGDTGATGATGNGIASITLTDTTGSVKTYTITFTNGDTTTFQVTDGEVTNAILEKVLPTDTKSGSIASFPDGTDLFPALSCVADIDPAQDLHGYDNPWVGGAGANKWDEQTQKGYYNASTGQFNNSNDQICSVNPIPVQPSTSYYIKTPSALRICYYEEDMTFISAENKANQVITTPANCKYINLNTFTSPAYPGGTTYQHDIALNYPSSVTTYSPYSNICPISGWNSVEVVDCGVNLFDGVLESGTINSTTGVEESSSSVKRSTHFFVVGSQVTYFSYASGTVGVRCYDKNKAYIGNVPASTNSTFTTLANTRFVRFVMSNGVASNPISINYPSTDHDYHAYNGTTYTTSLGTTVYGGTLDVVSGELTVTWGSVDLGSLSWSADSSNTNLYKASVTGKKYGNTNILSDRYEINAVALSSLTNGQMRGYSTSAQVFIKNDAYTTKEAFKTAMEGVYLFYELSTPTTTTLTAQQVDLLLGMNNIFADSGDVTVEYKADIQRYIAKKLAE